MNIRQKIKGNKKYYYLEHSTRKGEKVVKKEKYLGASIPKNIEEIKQIFEKELRSDLYKKLELIKKNYQR